MSKSVFKDGIELNEKQGLLKVSEVVLTTIIKNEPITNVYDVEDTPFARGKFAAVRRCTHKATGVAYAAKCIRKRRRLQDQRADILHEVAVLLTASTSDRIVRLHEVYETNNEMAIVLELAQGGELQRVVEAEDGLEESHTVRVMKHILEALVFLHSRNIAHLDLKPQNILLSTEEPNTDIKLCDFGISRIVQNGVEVKEILGTPDYVAPEILKFDPISLKSDIWSVGVLAYVLLSGYSPFAGDTKQETFCNITKCDLTFPDELFGDVSPCAKHFIQATLRTKPSDRLSAQECLDHPWISGSSTICPSILTAATEDDQADTPFSQLFLKPTAGMSHEVQGVTAPTTVNSEDDTALQDNKRNEMSQDSERKMSVVDPNCRADRPQAVTFADVTSASFKMKNGVINTPCLKSHMSDLTGMEIFLKKDFMQTTGSFKERGACYALLMLSEAQRKKGVISASLGNHAQALCYHGQRQGVPVTVVMPVVAPIMKVQACRRFGATVIVEGNDMKEAKHIAMVKGRELGLTYINGYDHPHIIAGQGTLGLEIVEQVENIDAVVVPVGGGGLIAGIALAVKSLHPNVKIIGVESEKCPSFSKAMSCGKPTLVPVMPTLADGLAVPLVGYNAFYTAQPLIDKMVVVKEDWIAIAILRLVEMEKCVVEGAGAVGLAAILAGHLQEFQGKRVVLILCGGNIDTTILGRCLDRGLTADGRLLKFSVVASDRPGGIAELCRLLADVGVSIKDILHERAWITNDVFSVKVKIVCESRDIDHTRQLMKVLTERYKSVSYGDFLATLASPRCLSPYMQSATSSPPNGATNGDASDDSNDDTTES